MQNQYNQSKQCAANANVGRLPGHVLGGANARGAHSDYSDTGTQRRTPTGIRLRTPSHQRSMQNVSAELTATRSIVRP